MIKLIKRNRAPIVALLLAAVTIVTPSPLALKGGAPADSHEQLNPVYRELRNAGLQFSPSLSINLPEPTMPDGMTGEQQTAIIRKLAGAALPLSELLRESIVAPQIIRITTKLRPGRPENPRAVDVWFIAYGDLKKAASKEFLDRLVSIGEGEGKGKSLSEQDLLQRGIKIAEADKEFETYGHGHADLFQKVRIKATGHSYWSETDDSIITASKMDPRFTSDAAFPNRWHSLLGEGKLQKLGLPNPYQGVGYYMKITRLERPSGALFVEAHILFGEPSGWFNNANMLRSKLPKALETKVRDIRREFAEVMRGKS